MKCEERNLSHVTILKTMLNMRNVNENFIWSYSHEFLFQASIWNSNFEFFQPLSELTDGVGWTFFSLLSTYDFNINHQFKKFCVPPSWLRALFAVIYEFSAAFQTTWNIVKRLFEVQALCEAKITKNSVLRCLGGVDGDSAMNFH